MLADRALKVALDIIRDYKKFGIVKLLEAAVNAAQTRGSGNYPTLVNAVLAGFHEAQTKSIFNSYPPDFYQWLDSTQFGPLLTPKISARILAGFSGDISNHISANEIVSIREAANELLANCLGYSRFASLLGIGLLPVPDGTVAIDLGIPETVFGGPFSNLIEVYKHFDRFFQTTAELSGLARDSIQVERASSSIITLVLTTAQEHYMAFIAAYTATIGAALKTIELYKTISDLRTSGMPEEVVRSAEGAREGVRDSYIDSMIDELLRSFSKIDEPRKNEIRSELKICCSHVLDDIINGARVTLSIENYYGNNLSSISSDAFEGRGLLGQLQHMRQIENDIERISNSAPDVIKALTNQRGSQSSGGET